MMTRSFQNDLAYGLDREESVLIALRKAFCDETIKNTKELYKDNYCKWDFENLGGTKWELKSRRNAMKQYPTTIIPVHKCDNNSVNNNLYFVFKFTDGIYYIQYEPLMFQTFNKKTLTIKRAGKYDPPTDHWEIPVNLLKALD
jgi:hypothetical protein